MTERLWSLKQSRLFQQLSVADLSLLEGHARVREFSPRQVIYSPADASESIFLVVRGRVRIVSLTSEGKEAVLGLIEPGELFGEMALVSQAPREEHAEAALASTIAAIPREALESAMGRHGDLSLEIWKFIGWRRQRIERRLRGLLFRSTRERVLLLLVDLAEQYGRPSRDGTVDLGIRLSHQEIANLIGATRESVTVTLGDLQSEGLVTLGRQRIAIASMERLGGMAGVTRPLAPPKPAPEPPPARTVIENCS